MQSPISKGDHSVRREFALQYMDPFSKEVSLKGKNLLPRGSQFFPLRGAPLSKGTSTFRSE